MGRNKNNNNNNNNNNSDRKSARAKLSETSNNLILSNCYHLLLNTNDNDVF